MSRICFVEDQEDLRMTVSQALSKWYQVVAVGSLAEAQQLLEKETFDLMLLDVNLRDGNGFEFCARLRSQSSTQDLPVIFLTGRNEPVDKMMGFSIGGDDYLTKPFEPVEARARIEARLKKRGQPSRSDSEVLEVGPLVFDRVKQRVFVKIEPTGRDLGLTALEFKLLFVLASQEGRVLSRGELIKGVWNPDVHVSEESLYTHISALRRKLGDRSDMIECIPRVGYRILSHPKKY